MDLLQKFNTALTATRTYPELRPGVTVKVRQKIKDGAKTRLQTFEGIIIARKHGSGPSATITVRKVSDGIGVERIFPILSPTVEKFEVVRISKVRRAKLYYLRTKSARETRRKTKLLTRKATTSESQNKAVAQ